MLKSNSKLLISGVEMRKELVVEVVDFIMDSGKSYRNIKWYYGQFYCRLKQLLTLIINNDKVII